MLVDTELTAASACTPVHVPDPISGDELTDVGELDPLRLLARHVVSREDLCLRRPQQGAYGLLRRVHLERSAPVDYSLVPEQAELIARTEVDPPERERTPADTRKSQRQDTFFARDETERARIGPFFDLEPGRKLEQHVDLLGPVARPKADPDVQQLPFESALAVELDLDVDTWRANLQRAERQDQCERRGEQHQFREAQHERGQQSQRRQSRVRAQLG